MSKFLHPLAVLALLTCALRAHDSLPALLAERRAVLNAIVEQIEGEHQAGRGSIDELSNARVNLARFDLEVASTLPERQKLQRNIIEIEQLRYDTLEKLHQSGQIKTSDLFAAKDRLLKEKIGLLNLK